MSDVEKTTDELIETYESMTAEEKIAALDDVLRVEVAPLDAYLAFLLILKPVWAKEVFARLKRAI